MDTCHPADLQETGRGGPWCPGRCEAPAGVDGGGVLQPPSCPARSSAPPIHSQNGSREGGRERLEEKGRRGPWGGGCRISRREAATAPTGLPALATAPAGRGAGGSGAQPRAARPSEWPARAHRAFCRLPALRCSAGPRRFHAPPPAARAPRHRASSACAAAAAAARSD